MNKNDKKKFDKLISQKVRGDCPVCVWCGARSTLHIHHVFSRVHLATRYYENNLAPLCGGCHMKAHREPVLFHEFWKSHLGSQNYERLAIMAYSVKKYDAKLMALSLLKFQESI